jgi:hypothetical protein
VETINEQILYLFGIRYPIEKAMYFAGKPVVASGVDGKHIASERRAELNAYLQKLQSLATTKPEEFAALVAEAEETAALKGRIEAAKRQAEADKIESAWAFNKPYAIATPEVYDHWAQRRWWKMDDALSLLLGRNPTYVKLEDLNDAGNSSAFVRKYAELRAIALTHVGGGDGQLYDPIHPGVFLRWAERYKKAIPPELLASVKEYGHNVKDWQDAYKQKEAEAERWESAYKKMTEMVEGSAKHMNGSIDLLKAKNQRIAELETLLAAKMTDAALAKAQDVTQNSATSSAPDPTKWLSRTAIKNLFAEISEGKWRGLFGREEQNGLMECRMNNIGEDPLYDPERIARWIGNSRSELTLVAAMKRIQVGSDDAHPLPPHFPTAHDPFGRTR